MSPAPCRSQRYLEGDPIPCTNLRGGRDGLPCTHIVAYVPRNTISTARAIRSNADADPDTVPIQCKHCKGITEVRTEHATAAA